MLGENFLKRIISSLDEAFESNSFTIHKTDEKYHTLDINDNGHTCGLIVFYIIREQFDVYNLAYKEIVN